MLGKVIDFATYNVVVGYSIIQDLLFGRNLFNNLKFPSKRGHVAVVADGSLGVGCTLVKGLVKCGVKVVAGVRGDEKYSAALEEYKKYAEFVELIPLDTSSTKSVKNFAQKVNDKYKKIHVLVNNAESTYETYAETEDNFEKTQATNFLGHVLLTHLLMPALASAGNLNESSRIVNVSSPMHATVNLQLQDTLKTKNFSPREAYAQSKLAQLMFSRFLDMELERRMVPVRCHAVSTGLVDSAENSLWSWACMHRDNAAADLIFCSTVDNLHLSIGSHVHNADETFSTPLSWNIRNQKELFLSTCKKLDIPKFYDNFITV